jgi:hypothetical protein
MDIGKVIDIKDCKRGYILKGVANHEVKYKNEKPVIGHFMIFLMISVAMILRSYDNFKL